MRKHPKVIIITGPCGVGKTTITNILSQKIEVKFIDGDQIKQRLFPEIVYINKHPDKLEIMKQTILELSKTHFSNGKSVLIDGKVGFKPLI